MRRIGGIAGKAGNAGHAVVVSEIRLERPVVDRPVIRYAIECPYPEVGRMQAWVVRREEDRAAANTVKVGDLHYRVVVVDRVVGVACAAVWTNVKIGIAARFPIAPVARKFGG